MNNKRSDYNGIRQLLISHASMWKYLRHDSKRRFLCFHHSSSSTTVRTDFNTSARFSTSPITTITFIETGYFDVSLPSKYRLFKAQIKVITERQEKSSNTYSVNEKDRLRRKIKLNFFLSSLITSRIKQTNVDGEVILFSFPQFSCLNFIDAGEAMEAYTNLHPAVYKGYNSPQQRMLLHINKW